MSHSLEIKANNIGHDVLKRKASNNRVTLTNITNRPKRNCRRICNFRTLEIQEAFKNLDIMEPPPEKRRRSKEATVVATKSDCSIGDDGDPIQTFGLKLVKILGTHYFDVKDRLQLTVMPRCSLYVRKCSKQHTKAHPPELCEFNISFDNENERPTQFLQSLTAMLARNEFPGETMILSLLKMMMTINKSANQILAESLNVLSDILAQYPPCWPGAKDVYLRVLDNPLVANAGFISERYNKELGIMTFLIDTLEFLMETGDGESGSCKAKKNHAAADSEENAFNFFLWEMQQIAAKNLLFDKLSRDDKIARIFMILSFLVDLLEKDLVMWLMKHPKNVSEYMESETKRPLIAHVVWPNAQEVGQMNGFVKKIIKVFIHSVMLRYPSNSKQILGRLFNLLAVAVNLSEHQFEGIMYPFLRSKSEMLVKELGRQVEASSYYDVDNVLNILDATLTPYVKMLLVDHVCNKLYPHKGTPSIQKYWQNFQNKLWQTSGTVSATPHSVAPTSSRSSSLSTMNRYPLLEPDYGWVTKKLRFDQQQYLQLLLVGIRAYFSVYRVSDLIKVSSKRRNSSEGVSPTGEPRCVTLPTIPTVVFTELTVDVNVMVYYRDELKYFVLLRNLIGEYKNEFGKIFDEFDEFMKQCMEG